MPGPIKAKQNDSPVAYANQIKDPAVRNAVLEIFRQIGTLTTGGKEIGAVTKPLTQHLVGSNKQGKQFADPTDPQDVVTLRFLQSYVANFTAVLGGSDTPATPAVPNVDPPTDQSGIVEAARVSLGISATSTPFELFKFAQTVVWNINALGPDPVAGDVGLLHQDAGDGVYFCVDMADTLACFRICYLVSGALVGANIKILTGSYTTQWTQEADIPAADWVAPTDPAVACP